MCGFVGYAGSVLPKNFEEACSSIAHRGPDELGAFDDGCLHLRHYRLRVLDLEGSRQPFLSDDDRAAMVYNGEIYNFAELRKSLMARGVTFYSSGDTEVVLKSFLQYGFESFGRLNGIFAGAIYDSDSGELWLFRDPFGVKPLYYHIPDNGDIIFASELKALVRSIPELSQDIDYDALNYLLSFKYLPEKQTLLKGIKKLEPGFFMKYSIKDKSYFSRKYSDMAVWLDSQKKTDKKEFFDEFRGAVRRQLVSDVPVGAFLSGGIDSSCIVAMMRDLNPDQELNTFSVIFPGEKWNEEEYSDLVARQCRSKHTKIQLKPEDFWKYLPKVIWHLEEPFSDPAALPTYILAGEAKKKVTVVLTGEGADELLLGYKKYRLFRILNILRLPILRNLVLLCVGLLPDESGYRKIIEADLQAKDDVDRIIMTHSVFSSDEKDLLLRSSSKSRLKFEVRRHLEKYFSEGSFMKNLQVLDMRTWLVNDPLLKMDKMTMAHGLEGRVPFLDIDFARYCLSLKERYKLSVFLTDKWILRKAMREYLPAKILKRAKHPFNIPIKIFKEEIKNFLSRSSIEKRGLFQYDAVKSLLDMDWDSPAVITKIWLLVCVEVWLSTFVDNQAKGVVSY